MDVSIVGEGIKMSEEKGEGEKPRWVFHLGILLLFAILATGAVCTAFHIFSDMESNTQTKTLTILHAWEEGGQYYFADELGCVYLIVCEGDLWIHQKEELRYDDMPKIRFEKLKEGHRYHVEYVIRQGNVRMSLSEKEMKR